MIEVDALTVNLGGRRVLDSVSLKLSPGRLLALIGPSGSGKSIFLRALCGLVPIADGQVTIAGESVRGRTERELFSLRGRIGMLFQNNALFDTLTVWDNIAFPLRRRQVDASEVRERVDQALENVSLTRAADLLPSEVSGGMRKRVGIARAQVVEPEVALYDEPTAGLDPVSAAKILALLTRSRDEHGVTGIAVGHELSTLLAVCDDAAMLLEGRLVYHGPVAGLERAEHPAVAQFVTGGLEGPL